MLLGVLLTLGLGLLTMEDAVMFVHWEALGLIFGMFVLVAALKASGFFRWIGLHALRASRYHAPRAFALFCLLSAFLAAFMDSITVMLFMASLTLEVTKILGVRAIPFLVGEITSANIGGAATMVGDPPNVIIGTSLDLGFVDFLVNTAPIAVAVLGVNIASFYFIHRRGVNGRGPLPRSMLKPHRDLDPFSAVQDIRLMRIALGAFAFTVTLLILHQLLDLLVAVVALAGATVVLLLGGRDMPDLVEKVDWHTLVFLGGLFVIVGGVARTGVLADAAVAFGAASGGNPALLLSVVFWASMLLSMVLDNIPLTAAMVPIIQTISASEGSGIGPLAWSLGLGANIGGNGTPVGASANVVGLAVAEQTGVHISWPEYLRSALPVTLLAAGAANLLLVLRYVLL